MGAPNVFDGDLFSLWVENRRVYREGFSRLERLNWEYGIYKKFQYSGVPEPTERLALGENGMRTVTGPVV